ncbi:MAG: phosphate acyltransferase [Lachnospiraceae bacterium]
MEIKNFDELVQIVKAAPMVKGAVAAADDHTIEAACHAYEENVMEPIFIGKKQEITEILRGLGYAQDKFELIEEEDVLRTPYHACTLVNEGKASLVMKGFIDTSDFLRGILDKETGLRTGNPMSHVAVLEIPGYHKLIATTDGGMITEPDYDTKVKIIENAVTMFRGMGYECPKVAALTAVEKPNKAMPETMDARALQEANQAGIIKNCIVEGPVSYDIAMSKAAAEKKKFEGNCSENYDILLVPNISAGNLMSKAIIIHGGAKMSGTVVGAKVPLVLNSRSASAIDKFYAICLSVACTMHK